MNIPQYARLSELHKKAYGSFINMHQRCYNPHGDNYKYYGGRGIKIEGTWAITGELGYRAFIKDLGLPPDFEATLDRKDNNKNYSKENCSWASKKEQALNRRQPSYNISHIIAYAKSANKYRLYRYNLTTKMRTYLSQHDTRELAQLAINEELV